MSHERFMNKLTKTRNRYIDELVPPTRSVAGQHPNLDNEFRLRANPGKWTLGTNARIHNLINELVAFNEHQTPWTSLTDSAQDLIKHSAGADTSGLGLLEPNYIVKNNNLHLIDHEVACKNAISWLVDALHRRDIKSDCAEHAMTTTPGNAFALRQFASDKLQTHMAKMGYDSCDLHELMHACARFQSIQHCPDEESKGVMLVACEQLRAAKVSIPEINIRSRKHSRDVNCSVFSEIGAGHKLNDDGYTYKFQVHMRRNKQELDKYFGLAKQTFLKHHGIDGCRTQEAREYAKRGLIRGETATSSNLAKGSLSRVDECTLTYQQCWWHYEVTGWVACAIWASNMILCRASFKLTEQDALKLTEWVFARSTYRKFVASDTLLDSTRDISASEVTQAASLPGTWRAKLNPLVQAAEDLEYSVSGHMKTHDMAGIYQTILTTLASNTGSDYTKPLLDTPIKAPYGEKVPLGVNGASGTNTLVFGKSMVYGDGVEVHPCDVSKSDCVLLCVTKGRERAETRAKSKKGEPMLMVRQPLSEHTLTYISPPTFTGQGKDKNTAFLIGIHFRESNITCSTAIQELLCCFTSTYHDDGPLVRAKRLTALSDPKTTREHHRNLPMVTALATCGWAWAPCMDVLFGWEDLTNTYLTALLIAMASLPAELYALMIRWNGWQCASAKEYIANAKSLTTLLKALDNQVSIDGQDVDLSPLFEWEVLQHRAVVTTDIDDEILDRISIEPRIGLTPDEIREECDLFWTDVAAKLDKKTKPGGKSPIYMEWDKFYEDRVNNTPAGSAFTLNKDMLLAKRKLKNAGVLNITKTQLMATMEPELQLDELLAAEPNIIAQTSYKLEWAKRRALFAGPTEHWLPAAFALGDIEAHLPDDCPIGSSADAHKVCSKVMEMSKKGVVACLDAKNFNIMHTGENMREAILSAQRVLGNRISPDQYRCLTWLAKAELNQKMIVPRDKTTPELIERGLSEGWITEQFDPLGKPLLIADLKSGMFSGVRYTMLFNTLFNRVYYKIAEKRAKIKSLSLHSGDDVYSVFASYSDAYKMKRSLGEIRYTLQLAKCFIEGVREFLRISHKNANTTQYLSRSCATMVHGRIESDAPTDFVSLANAIMRRGAELIVRHAHKASVLDIQATQIAGICARWAIPQVTWDSFVMLPKILGGIASGQHTGEEWRGYNIVRTAQTKGSVVEFLSNLPGVKSLAESLVDELGIRKYHRRVSEAVAAAMAPKGVIINYGMVVRWMTDNDLDHMTKVTGKLGYIRQSREYIISKAAGLFNTLAINDSYWGDITGVLRGIPSAWHSVALAFALDSKARLPFMNSPMGRTLNNTASSSSDLDVLWNKVKYAFN
nr:MAG: RdRP [Cordyceps militaris quadrivirus 1]